MRRKKKALPFKRKMLEKTDYKKRLRLLVSNKPRLVIRRSNKNILAQVIKFDPKGDKVLTSVHSNELKRDFKLAKLKKNTSAAYLLGLLLGLKSKKKNINEAILDIGLQTSRKNIVLYALLKGAIDAGLNVPHSKEMLPSEDRIKGSHLKEQIKNFEELKFKILKGEKNAKAEKK